MWIIQIMRIIWMYILFLFDLSGEKDLVFAVWVAHKRSKMSFCIREVWCCLCRFPLRQLCFTFCIIFNNTVIYKSPKDPNSVGRISLNPLGKRSSSMFPPIVLWIWRFKTREKECWGKQALLYLALLIRYQIHSWKLLCFNQNLSHFLWCQFGRSSALTVISATIKNKL